MEGGTRTNRRGRRALLGLGIGVIMLLPAWVQALPPPSQLSTVVAPNAGDPLFVTWTLGWEAHALLHHPTDVFAGNIFYPRRDAIAWSDSILVAVPVYAVVDAVSGGRHILAYNVVTLLGFAGVGWAVYALAFEVLRDRAGAVVAAVLVAWSAIRTVAVGHTQLTGFAFVALALLALLRFLRGRRWRHAVALGLAAAATWLMTAYYAILLALVGVAFLAVWLLRRRLRPGQRFWRGLALAGAVTLAAVAPTLPPYIRLQLDGTFNRNGTAERIQTSPGDAVDPPASLLYRVIGLRGAATGSDRGGEFPGVILLVLAAAGAAGALRDRRRSSDSGIDADRQAAPAAGSPDLLGPVGWPLFGGALVCVALVVGPGRAWGLSAPFTVLRSAVPGVSSLRSLDRFWVFPLLCLALVAGAGMRRIHRGLKPLHGALATLLTVALIAVELLTRPPTAPVDRFRQSAQIDMVLSRLPPGPVLELPEPLGPQFAYVNAAREYNSLTDLNRRIDGYSGNIPESVQVVESVAGAVPVVRLLEPMRAYGVRYLILHHEPLPCAAGYDAAEIDQLAGVLAARPAGVRQVIRVGGDLLVVLNPEPLRRLIPPFDPMFRPVDCGIGPRA